VRIIHNFTDHDLEHSKRVATWADVITKAYTGKGKLLSELETYLLLAGIYLHDIGMQCDLNKWPDIKQIAKDLGASFTSDFNTTISSAFTPQQQQEIRSNHQYLAAAWIEYAREHDNGALGTALKQVPSENVGDLKDISSYPTVSKVGDEMNGKRVRAGAVTVDEIETYTEDAEVTAAAAVNEMSLTRLDGLHAASDQPQIP